MSALEVEPAPVIVLKTGHLPASTALDGRFSLHDHPGDAERVAPHLAAVVRAIAAAGPRRITDQLMAELPALEIVANFGVGYDRVDVAAATRRGIVVTNTPDVLTEEVADFTLGLLIATARRIPQADRFVRSGAWAGGGAFPLSASLRGRRIGIVGMGRIGQAVARRCAAMGLEVAYFSRSPRPDLEYPYYGSPAALAEAVDVLVVVVPGGAETAGLIDARVIAALGPTGILINVGRGSVVDEAALIEALANGRLYAAGLDVYADEPRVPAELVALDNVVLAPHIGSATKTTRAAMGDLVLANIASWFGGKGALTPVNLQSRGIGK